jgi:mRNA interferase HigB
VVVVGREKIVGFQKEHPASAAPLNRWIVIVEAAAWKTTADVRATFGSADFVAGKVIFNIGGNKFRLMAAISFEVRIVSVEAVLTHKQYDGGRWK